MGSLRGKEEGRERLCKSWCLALPPPPPLPPGGSGLQMTVLLLDHGGTGGVSEVDSRCFQAMLLLEGNMPK